MASQSVAVENTVVEGIAVETVSNAGQLSRARLVGAAKQCPLTSIETIGAQNIGTQNIVAKNIVQGDTVDQKRRRGRGAVSNSSGRFEALTRHVFDDGLQTLDELPAFKTETQIEQPKSIISTNRSPDLPFDRSINPYRGCEHGCIYCFARPTHSYVGLSSGLDFESRLFAKPNAAQLLQRHLSRKGYIPKSLRLAPIPMPISRLSGNGKSPGRYWRCWRRPIIPLPSRQNRH